MLFAPMLLMALGARALPHSQTASPFAVDHLHLFVFGDSYTSTNFNVTGPQPSVSQPLGNPSVGTSPDNLQNSPTIFSATSANGPNWPIYLAVNENSTTTFLYDFAISGASIPDGFSHEILNEFIPQYSSQHGHGARKWNGDNSIFAIWISINDINWCSKLFSTAPSDFRTCLPPRLDEYFALMDALYNTGARRFFFVNMPPLWRAPMVQENGKEIIDNYQQGVDIFNQELFPSYVEDFSQTHEGIKVIIYDAFSMFTNILDHPGRYGFKDNTSYTCIGCRNGTGDFWANNYHPTTFVHEMLAKDMVSSLNKLGWSG